MNSQHSHVPMLQKWRINKAPRIPDSWTMKLVLLQPLNPEIYCYMSKSDHKRPSHHSSHAHRTPCNTIFSRLPLPAGAYLLRFVCSRHIIDAGLFHFVIISATISRQPSSLGGKAIKCALPLHKRASLSPNSSIAFWWHLDGVGFSVGVYFKRLPESDRSWWHCLENKRSTVSEPRQNKAPAKLEGKQWKNDSPYIWTRLATFSNKRRSKPAASVGFTG